MIGSPLVKTHSRKVGLLHETETRFLLFVFVNNNVLKSVSYVRIIKLPKWRLYLANVTFFVVDKQVTLRTDVFHQFFLIVSCDIPELFALEAR